MRATQHPLTLILIRGLPQELGRKAATLMRALQQQLGGRAHYDFGLRAFLAPVLRAAGARGMPAAPRASPPSMQGRVRARVRAARARAGALRRAEAAAPEDALLHRAVLDIAGPGVMRTDAPLFGALLADAFPGAPPAAGADAPLREAVAADLLEAGLQARSRRARRAAGACQPATMCGLVPRILAPLLSAFLQCRW